MPILKNLISYLNTHPISGALNSRNLRKITTILNRGNKIIMFQGIFTHGGLGAAQAFSDFSNANENIKELVCNANFSDELLFQTIFPVEVFNDEAQCPTFDLDFFSPIS